MGLYILFDNSCFGDWHLKLDQKSDFKKFRSIIRDACLIFWILNSSAICLFIPHKANFSFYERCYISQIRYNCCSNLSV